MKINRKITVGLLAVFMIAGVGLNLRSNITFAEDDADDIRDKLGDLQKKQEKTQKELDMATTLYNNNQYRITVTKNLIETAAETISRKETELDNLEKRTELQKKFLEEYLRDLYYSGQEDPLVKLAVQKKDLANIVSNYDKVLTIKEKILITLAEIKQLTEETEGAKTELEEKKKEHEGVLSVKKAEQGEIYGEIQEKKLTLSEIQQKISKLRSILSSFLGESYSMDDVINAVKSAAKKTGVRKEFLFAMLDKETDLGRFTGGCTYKKSKMGDYNLEIFKNITDELGYDYKKMKVSCPLSYGIGGAMGVAQFMPSTWGDPDGSPSGWRPKIKKIVGHEPDPWDLEDGIIGMALKLKAAGANKKSGEHYAAKVYYCGGPGSKYWKTHCEAYANTVISWSKGYDDYF